MVFHHHPGPRVGPGLPQHERPAFRVRDQLHPPVRYHVERALQQLPTRAGHFRRNGIHLIHRKIHSPLRQYMRDRYRGGNRYPVAQKRSVDFILSGRAIVRRPTGSRRIKSFGDRLILRRQCKLIRCPVRHFSSSLHRLRVHRWQAPESPASAYTPTIVPGDAPYDSSPSRAIPRSVALPKPPSGPAELTSRSPSDPHPTRLPARSDNFWLLPRRWPRARQSSAGSADQMVQKDRVPSFKSSSYPTKASAPDECQVAPGSLTADGVDNQTGPKVTAPNISAANQVPV